MEQEIQIPIENKSKPKRVPKLRFKEFDVEWKDRQLGNLGQFKGGGTPDTKIENYWIGSIPWISSSDIYEGDIHNIKIHKWINEKAIMDTATKIIPKESILLISRVGVGKLAINKEEICTSQDFSNFSPINNDSYFLGYFLIARKNLLLGFAQGTSIKGFTTSDIKDLKLNIPSLPEQQKIATFLSAVDKKIQQLTRKKELLETYKKGVMQQLFSQQLRFKDENGKDFPKWERKKLNEIAEKNSRKNTDDVIKFVLTNSATEGIVSQSDYFDRSIANVNNLQGYYVVSINDFIYNPRISVHAPVGPIKRNKLKKGIMSPLYSVFKFNTGNLKFFEYYFETTTWHKYLNTVANFGARHDRMNITNSDFFKMPIPFPYKQEQQKIADFLSAIDIKIEAVSQQITKTKSFKKGLLQQMFV